MRNITLLIVHCSAVRPHQTSTVQQIDAWHRKRGFRMIGYHYVIYRDGSVHTGRPESMVGAHCSGQNTHSIGICYEGGLDADGHACDTRTPQQKDALRQLLSQLHQRYPRARIKGHNQFARKACPCFPAEREYALLQPPH